MFGMPNSSSRRAPGPGRGRRRRLVGAVAAVLVTLGLGACAPASRAVDDDVPVVLTTFTVLADIAGNVAGEHLRVESITKVGAEIHGYEPTPGDIRRAAEADLVVDNGLGLEAWFARFTQGLDAERVVVSEGIETMPIGEGAYAGQPNPHAWMSPENVVVYVDNLVAAFSALDPDRASEYEANGAAYQARLRELQGDLVGALAVLPEHQRALVTCEGAFSYLARDAGLTERYIWPVNAEQQATPRQIVGVIEFVRASDVPAVFCESTVSAAPMHQVVAATDAEFGGVLYVDSLSEPDGPVPTYLDLIRHNADVIVAGLTGASR